jgi:glucosamine--fructose-6-phosphate aminotransferase (isomerizing)
MLLKNGYPFASETDTEAAANLIAFQYAKTGDALPAIQNTMKELVGSYALAILFSDIPNVIFAVKKESPLIVGITEEESFLASDIPAILPYTRRIYYMNNMEIAQIECGAVSFFDAEGNPVFKAPTEITWSAEAAEKDLFPHFMLKEIHEQPRAVRDTIYSLLKNGEIDMSHIGLSQDTLERIQKIHIIGCGSAYHVGVTASYVIEDIAGVPVRVEYASEFRYRKPIFGNHELAVIISQSGETADSLSALREVKKRGVHTLAIVNVVGSSIAREADHVLHTLAGPEIAVATTKAYSAQLAACYLFAIALGHARGAFCDAKYHVFLSEVLALPEKIEWILSKKEIIHTLAMTLKEKAHIFLIGRGLDFATCLEGSLKIKEISYIHSEAYAAGELKHGTISLIENDTPVIALLTQEALASKTLSNMREVKSRGARLITIASEDIDLHDRSDFLLQIPQVLRCFMPSLSVIPLQLLGYYLSTEKGLDVDKPRNLAKSVTVE